MVNGRSWSCIQLYVAAALAGLVPAALAAELSGTLRCEVPENGFLSAAVLGQDGQIVRTLLTAHPVQAGLFVHAWDARDDRALFLLPDEYKVRLLFHEGVGIEYVTSVHTGPHPGWTLERPSRSDWGADRSDPADVAAHGEHVYLLWYGGEAGDALIKSTADGRKVWGARLGGTRVAADDTYVYVADQERVMFRNTGDGRLTAFAGKLRELKPDHNKRPVGVAVTDQFLVVAEMSDGAVVLYDKASELRDKTRIYVPGIVDVAADEHGVLYAATKKDVYWIDRKAGKAIRLTREWYPGITGIAARQERIYLSRRDEAMQVQVLTDQGDPIGTIGKPGGRPRLGRFDPHGMLEPRGLAVTDTDELWVAEQDSRPRRFSVWSVRSGAALFGGARGRFLREYFGGAAYAPMMTCDPRTPERVYIQDCEFQVDYERGTSTMVSTVFRPGLGGATLEGTTSLPAWTGTGWQIRYVDDHRLAADGRGGVYDASEDFFKPLSYLGRGLPPLAEGREDVYCWIDRSADGFIQENEATRWPGHMLLGDWGNHLCCAIGPRLEAYWTEAAIEYPIRRSGRVWTLPSPSSDPVEWRVLADSPARQRNKHERRGLIPSRVDPNTLYMGSRNAIERVTAGKVEWAYRRARGYSTAAHPPARPGDLFGVVRFGGAVLNPPEKGGELVCVACYRGYFGLLSQDGLFVAQLGQDTGTRPPIGFDTIYVENVSGTFFRHARTGKDYIFTGNCEGRIWEVTGLDTLRTWETTTRVAEFAEPRLPPRE